MIEEPVRLVIWDLDETFWRGTVSEGGLIEYVDDHHNIVIELSRRGIINSICSKNDSKTVLTILEQKGIADYFVFPSIAWEPKGSRVSKIVEQVQLRAETVMFIDDNPSNRAEVLQYVPGIQIESEKFISHMLDDRRFKGKPDHQLSRLAQYQLLQARNRDEQASGESNEAFLQTCDIRVMIEHDVEAHIDRAIELVNRTNQLNFTKKRLPENIDDARAELRAQMHAFDRVAGLVKVVDKYGDYGFVGFFLLAGMRRTLVPGSANSHLIHFCFSCRTLGMLVEYWTYVYLGKPEIDGKGEVLTDLSIDREIDWIRLANKAIDTNQTGHI